MIPQDFPQANTTFGPPVGMTKDQVRVIAAHRSEIKGGSLDGQELIVTAWKPTPAELADLNAGGLLYFCSIGGLPPHYLTTEFEEAINLR
jgi:hypothetical protein